MNEQPDDAIPEDALAHLDAELSDEARSLLEIEPWIESTLAQWNSHEEGVRYSRAEVIRFLEVQLDPLGTELGRVTGIQPLTSTEPVGEAPTFREVPIGPVAHPAGSASVAPVPGLRQIAAEALRRVARLCDALAEGLGGPAGIGRTPFARTFSSPRKESPEP